MGNDAMGIARGPEVRSARSRSIVVGQPRTKVGHRLEPTSPHIRISQRVFRRRIASSSDVETKGLGPVISVKRLADHAGKFGIDQDDLCPAMIDWKAMAGGRVRRNVEGVEPAPAIGKAKCS